MISLAFNFVKLTVTSMKFKKKTPEHLGKHHKARSLAGDTDLCASGPLLSHGARLAGAALVALGNRRRRRGRVRVVHANVSCVFHSHIWTGGQGNSPTWGRGPRAPCLQTET